MKSLGLPTLVYRRERADMLQLFKIMNEFEKVNLDSIKLVENSNRGHKHELHKHYAKTRHGQNRFSNRVTNNWNSLDQTSIDSTTVNVFKSNLNVCWKKKDNKFNHE